MKIIKLQAENVKRLRAVTVTPDPSGALVIVGGRNAQGKQQPISEPVLTPNGWVKIGDLRVGDNVVGVRGRAIRVTAVHRQRERRVFKLTTKDGGETRCGPDHLWTVYTWGSGRAKRWISQTYTTLQLLEMGLFRGIRLSHRWALPNLDPVQFADQGVNLPIEPYALGVILGDGHIELTGYVSVTSADRWIIDQLQVRSSYVAERNEIFTLGSAEWSRPLVHLGLGGKRSYEKFIPAIYKTSNENDRRSLLAGLVDTDGTPSENWTEFCTVSKALADDVTDVARGLGYVVNVTARTKKYTYLGEHKEGRICYIVRIKRGPCPFRLKRKVERWKPSRRNDAFRFIDRIEQVAEEKSVCIEVDSPEGLYVTSDYIVTHNSSVLDSISMTLGGKREVCERPLRDGTQAGYSVVEIGDGDGPLPEDLIAQRTYGPGGAETIIVQARDGRKHSTPQKVLDRMVGTLAFDPVGFLRLTAKEQAAMLRELLGVDTADLDAQYKAIYDKRTDANRDAKSWATRVDDAMPRHLDAPEAEVPAREVLEQIDDARAINQKSHDTRARHQRAIEEEGRLQRMVEEAQRQLEKASADRALLDDLMLTLEDIDEAPLRAALDQCEEVNAKVRANAQRAAALQQLTAISDEAARLTDLLTKIEGERAARLAAAPNPLPGLALTDGRVVYQGVPLEQCSSAEQLRVAVALGLAQNPKLKVLLVRDGSLLDPENLALLGELAAAHDAQVWVEVVGEREGCAVVIEDGTVKEMAVAPSKEASDV